MGDFGVPPVDISKFAKRMADINDLVRPFSLTEITFSIDV